MINKVKEKINKENKPPFLVLRISKQQILFLILIIIAGLLAYSAYFKYFMILPQAAINIMPKYPISLEKQKILLISPHCDDESLGSAGLMQIALEGKSEVKVVITTDCNHRKIGQTRKDESLAALSLLGVPKERVDFLNFPEIESNKKNNPQGLNIDQAIDKEINDFKPTLIISPHPSDTHIDHKIAGQVVQKLISDKYKNIKVSYYLIHYNFLRYPNPSGLHPNDYLLPPVRLISHSDRWYILDLSNDQEDDKQEAVLKYRSQLSLKNPILHEILLDFVRKNELFMIPN